MNFPAGDSVFLDIALTDGLTDFREVKLQHGRLNLRQEPLGVQLERSCYVSPVALTAEEKKKIDWKANRMHSWTLTLDPGSYVYLKERPGETASGR